MAEVVVEVLVGDMCAVGGCLEGKGVVRGKNLRMKEQSVEKLYKVMKMRGREADMA